MAATLDDIEAELHGEIFAILGDILQVLKEGGGQKGGGEKGGGGGGLNLAAIAGTITGLVGSLVRFTAALNPGVAQAFGTAISGLAATIGQAALPAVMVLTNLVGDLAGKISPLAQQLAPVLAQIANAIGAVLLPVVGILATALQIVKVVLEPFVRILADLMQVWGALAKVTEALMQAFLSYIQGLFGGGIQDASDKLHKAFEKLANQLLVLFASLLSLLGLDDAVKKLLLNLEKEGKDKGVAAAGQTSFSGFSDVARTIALNAAKSGFGEDSKDKFNFGEAIAGIKGVLEGSGGYLKEIRDFLLKSKEGVERAADVANTVNQVGADVFWGVTGVVTGVPVFH